MGCCGGKTTVKESDRSRETYTFTRTHARVEISDGGTKVTKVGGGKDRVAALSQVMTEGRHFAEFRMGGGDVLVGLIRPEFDTEEGNNAHKEEEHCFYQPRGGYKYPGGAQWGASTDAAVGDRISVLLDLDAGSLTVFKNDERLGMMAAGLTGSYSWAVVLYDKGATAEIRKLPPPTVNRNKGAADEMTEDEAATFIQKQVRARATVATADETRPAS